MKTHIRNRRVTFRHEDGCLVRTVEGPDGRTYVHRCQLRSFEAVAHAMDETERSGEGRAMDEIAATEKLPSTQVDVALAFLGDRGVLERRHRRNFPATPSVHLDAMVEWHALAAESAST